MTSYNNTCISLTHETTPDPYILFFNDNFYLTFTAGDRVEIWSAPSLPDFSRSPRRHVIWRPPAGSHHSSALWAPELHSLRGRWYVYYAAEDPSQGNKSHRMYVLGGPAATEDPTGGRWEFLGLIVGMDQHQWAIDGTVIELDHNLYFVYSGWPFDNTNDSELTQELFIVRLSDPLTADSTPTCLCQPHEPWERSGQSGINEGPQFLQALDKSWTGLVYSCAGSWTSDYKMNTLQYLGGDPLERTSWKKGSRPLITNNSSQNGPWGPGHGSFIHIDQETFAVYHATDSPRDGWNNRKARMQRLVFREGQPFMGSQVGPHTRDWSEFVGKSPHQTHQQASGSTITGFFSKMKAKLRDEL